MSAADNKPDEGGFLTRWSRKKIEARTTLAPGDQTPDPVMRNPSTGKAIGAEMLQTPHQSSTFVPAPPTSELPAPSPELPPIESLTPTSDFAPFMAEGVKRELRNAALKTLFSDPHFNQMDGLDTYIDDYNIPAALPEKWARAVARDKAEKEKLEREAAQGGPAKPGEVQAPPDASAAEVPVPRDAGADAEASPLQVGAPLSTQDTDARQETR